MYAKPSRDCTMFTRSAAACQTDPTNIKSREQLNLITSYIDGSQVYGSSLEEANTLRDFTAGNAANCLVYYVFSLAGEWISQLAAGQLIGNPRAYDLTSV